MVIQSIIRKWGNSMGVVVPKDVLREKNLQEGEEVTIIIEKKRSIKELFGSLKSLKVDSQKLKDELRKEWAY